MSPFQERRFVIKKTHFKPFSTYNSCSRFSVLITNGQPCRFNLTATPVSQVLTSPNYPDDYEIDITCVWIITSPTNNKVEIEFSEVDVEDTFDFIYVSWYL